MKQTGGEPKSEPDRKHPKKARKRRVKHQKRKRAKRERVVWGCSKIRSQTVTHRRTD